MSGEDYITRSFSKYYSGGQIKKNEMCGACRTYEGEEKCIEGLGGINLKGRNHLEDLVIDREIILKWIFKSRMGEWTGFIWLRIGTGKGGAVVKAVMNLRVP
jgi:hypothetical protein